MTLNKARNNWILPSFRRPWFIFDEILSKNSADDVNKLLERLVRVSACHVKRVVTVQHPVPIAPIAKLERTTIRATRNALGAQQGNGATQHDWAPKKIVWTALKDGIHLHPEFRIQKNVTNVQPENKTTKRVQQTAATATIVVKIHIPLLKVRHNVQHVWTVELHHWVVANAVCVQTEEQRLMVLVLIPMTIRARNVWQDFGPQLEILIVPIARLVCTKTTRVKQVANCVEKVCTTTQLNQQQSMPAKNAHVERTRRR